MNCLNIWIDKAWFYISISFNVSPPPPDKTISANSIETEFKGINLDNKIRNIQWIKIKTMKLQLSE